MKRRDKGEKNRGRTGKEEREEKTRKKEQSRKNLSQTSEQGLFTLDLLRACLHGKVRTKEAAV